MIRIIGSEPNKKQINEGNYRQFNTSDQRNYPYAEDLPSGDRPYIYKGKFGDIIITGEAEAYDSPDTVSIIIYIDNGYLDDSGEYPDVYLLRDQYEDDVYITIGKLSKYVDDDLYNMDKVANRFGFDKIDLEEVEFIPNLGSLL